MIIALKTNFSIEFLFEFPCTCSQSCLLLPHLLQLQAASHNYPQFPKATPWDSPWCTQIFISTCIWASSTLIVSNMRFSYNFSPFFLLLLLGLGDETMPKVQAACHMQISYPYLHHFVLTWSHGCLRVNCQFHVAAMVAREPWCIGHSHHEERGQDCKG